MTTPTATVKIKRLERVKNEAATPFGKYYLYKQIHGLWILSFNGEFLQGFQTIYCDDIPAAADAVAQADLNKRINSILEPDAPPLSSTDQTIEAAAKDVWHQWGMPEYPGRHAELARRIAALGEAIARIQSPAPKATKLTPLETHHLAMALCFPHDWRERNGGMGSNKQKIWTDGFKTCRAQVEAWEANR